MNPEELKKQLEKGTTIPRDKIKYVTLGKPKVSSVYDKVNGDIYHGVPAAFVFLENQSWFDFAVKKVPDFCIKELDNLPNLKTTQPRAFENRYLASEAIGRYKSLSAIFSDEELLVCLGAEFGYYYDPEVIGANDKKLERYRIEKAPLKKTDLPYLSFFRFNLAGHPVLNGEWILENVSPSDKRTCNVFTFRWSSADMPYSLKQKLNNSMVAIFDSSGYLSVLDDRGNPYSPSNNPVTGSKFSAQTTKTPEGARHVFRKIKS